MVGQLQQELVGHFGKITRVNFIGFSTYSNMVSMIRFYLMTYIDLFKFLENPSKKWKELTTKPPDKQLSLF